MHSLTSTLRLAKQVQYALHSNAGLDAAESKKEFSVFVERVSRVIRIQSNKVAGDKDLIGDLVTILGKAEPNRNMVSFLSGVFVSFKSVYEELFGDGSIGEFYGWAGTEGGQNALDRMGIDLTFVLRNDSVTEHLKQREVYLIDSVDATTKDQIVRIIQESRETQATDFQIAQQIREQFKEISPHRAEAIARTELAEAFNFVEFETYKRNQVQKTRWVTVIDERVCPICAPLHNMEMTIGDAFITGVTRPPAHPNCRCFIEEVMSGVSVRGNAIVWTGE